MKFMLGALWLLFVVYIKIYLPTPDPVDVILILFSIALYAIGLLSRGE